MPPIVHTTQGLFLAAPAGTLGVDWFTPNDPAIRSRSLLANAVLAEDIDLSELPINAAAIVRWSHVAFKTSGDGALDVAAGANLIAFRDSDGGLNVDLNAWASQALGIGSVLVGVVGVTAPDANTVRLSITNGNHTTRLLFRFAVSIVLCPVPVAPLAPA